MSEADDLAALRASLDAANRERDALRAKVKHQRAELRARNRLETRMNDAHRRAMWRGYELERALYKALAAPLGVPDKEWDRVFLNREAFTERAKALVARETAILETLTRLRDEYAARVAADGRGWEAQDKGARDALERALAILARDGDPCRPLTPEERARSEAHGSQRAGLTIDEFRAKHQERLRGGTGTGSEGSEGR